MEDCHERYGEMFTLNLVPRAVSGPGAAKEEGTWVFLTKPEHVRQVFSADPYAVLTGETNRFLEPVVGPRSILVLDEPAHMIQRRLLLPPLHGERVQAYAELMREVAEREVERWPIGEPFALWPRMQAITLEVIVRAVFGVTDPDRLERMQDLLRTMLNRGTQARWVLGQALFGALARSKEAEGSRSRRRLLGPVDEVLLAEIRERRTADDLADREDILSTLIQARYEDGSALSDEELRDELITLLIAGHESTATELAWAFERLLRHPEALARVREEADGGGSDYADAVTKETLRTRPVLPIVLRKLAEPIELGGYELPADTWLAPCAYLIHRRPDIYPDPLSFRPERFLDNPPGTYTLLPFGGGVRRCLGASFAQLEIREVLQTVVRRVELRAASAAAEKIKPRFITLVPSDGARVVADARRL